MLILASKSPRRKQLMGEDITHNFVIKPYEIDEEKSLFLPPLKAVKDIAKRKGKIAHSFNPQDIVLSADTIVVIDNQIIGKPKDKKDAKRILHLLSGRTHKVITAYCIFYNRRIIQNHVISKVTFNVLTDKMIDDYIATGSPMDKAGAYGYQDNKDFALVKTITGSIKNVIGFPSDEILADLKNNELL